MTITIVTFTILIKNMIELKALLYKATCLITGQSYIGLTKDYNKRKQEHKSRTKTDDTNNKFYNALRRYGWDLFEWQIIYESWDYLHTRDIMEPYFIREYDSYHNGYNSTMGGDGAKPGIKYKPWSPERLRMNGVRTKIAWANTESGFHSTKFKESRARVNISRHRAVIDPNGILYDTLTNAAKAHNTHKMNILYRVQHNKDGWRYA